MHEMDFITKEEYDIAINDPIKVELKTEDPSRESKAPEFTEYVRRLLQVKAEKFGFDLYRDGLKVYTTLDTRFQKHAEDAVEEQINIHQKSFNRYWSWKNKNKILSNALDKYIKQTEEYKKSNTGDEREKIYNTLKNSKSVIDSVKKLTTTIQIGFVAIDHRTGHIKAMIGANPNTRFKYGLNHVTQIKRQPGSSFKPFVYTVAINSGYTPGYMISNEPLKIHDGGRMRLLRGGGQGGNLSLRYALAKSVNVVAVRTAIQIAPIDKVIDLAHNMGIKSELPSYPILALGVGEVSPLEMTNAFGTFANEGIWVEPIAITKIEDRNGNIIEEIIPETREVLSEGVAYIMSDILEDVIDYGTATSVRRFFHRPAAGKTGTSQNYTDSWFVGYTPQFVAGVWLGFDDARIKFGGSYGQGGRAAAPIWGRFMKYLYSDDEFDFPVAYFLMPDDVDEVNVCMVTGLLGGESCPSDYELILKRYQPKRCTISHSFIDSLETAFGSSTTLPPEGNLEPPDN
jgi:penicillin-binding protein 1A